jgi:hypothetical protein
MIRPDLPPGYDDKLILPIPVRLGRAGRREILSGSPTAHMHEAPGLARGFIVFG